MATKKKISVIALDPRAGKSYGEDIAGLFSDVADISVFSMLDGSAAGVLERADLFVASTDAYGSPEELAKHIPLDSQTMAIEASFRWSELRKLKELPAGSKVLFVNMTETMAREAIAQLEQFGITHIHWIPFYPGASLEEDVHIAVTPDEMRYVPPKMETVIDIGQRVCTSGMMIEIALRLGLESLLEGPAFQEYARSVATSNYSFDQMFARSVRLESLFHILLESLEDGVIGMGEVADPAECAKIASLGIGFLAAGIGRENGARRSFPISPSPRVSAPGKRCPPRSSRSTASTSAWRWFRSSGRTPVSAPSPCSSGSMTWRSGRTRCGANCSTRAITPNTALTM